MPVSVDDCFAGKLPAPEKEPQFATRQRFFSREFDDFFFNSKKQSSEHDELNTPIILRILLVVDCIVVGRKLMSKLMEWSTLETTF